MEINKELTQEECIITDSLLEYLLNIDDKGYLIQHRTFIIFEKFGINENRALFICEKLNILKVFELKSKYEDRASIHFEKSLIKEFLSKGGMTDIWLEREKKRINIKLSEKTLKQFPFTRSLGIVSAITSGCLLLKELYKILCKTN